ncbi:MAG: sugar ABC transporter ATP-binding protein [Anaerolineae bacterium]|nr:sugar ABC transporter ATP-binding protein [Anaerolineae bacterium]
MVSSSQFTEGSQPAVQPLIEAHEIVKHFGGTVALNQASFSCQRGSIHALIGENGAGKSTLIKILCGVVTPDSGTILIDGQPSKVQSPADANRAGIVPVFQELSLLPTLTVAENIFIANPPRSRTGLISRRELRQQTEQLFDNLGFHHVDPSARISELQLAQRQLVEIAKAMSQQPRLLIMDEGTSALSIQDVELVFKIMRRMRNEGRSVIFISHRMGEVKEIADTLTIFRDGQNVGSFPMGAVHEDEMVQLMIGRKLTQVFPPKPVVASPRKPALDVSHLSWEQTLHDITFSVGKGEIVGLGGLDGQGQGELLFALFGLLRGLQGEIRVDGDVKHITSPASAARAGINLALIPEDRKTEGLILSMSVGANATLTTIDRLSIAGLINRRQERAAVQRVIDQIKVKTPSAQTTTRNLSGGNQQKVVIGKWLLTQAKIYLLHDPSRGIDVGTKQEIYQLMRTLADQSAAILFFSTELAELVGMCDRVLVLYEGRIFRELSGSAITEENIVASALGLNANEKHSAAKESPVLADHPGK